MIFKLLSFFTGLLLLEGTLQAKKTNTHSSTQMSPVTIAKDPDQKENDDSSLSREIKAEEEDIGSVPPTYTVFPAARTLPEKVIRGTTFYAYTYGDSGFSPDGEKMRQGFTIQRGMTGLILAYGLTKTVTIGVGVPIVVTNNVALNGESFYKSPLFKEYYNIMVRKVAEGIYNDPSLRNGLGPLYDTTSVDSIINSINTTELTLPGDMSLPLPTGETYLLKANTLTLKQAISAIISDSQRPVEGLTGIGDVQISVLWNMLEETNKHPFSLSMGGGLRVPTARFNVPRGYKVTGGDATLATAGGTYDAIYRFNLDYRAHPGLYLSFQNSTEYSLTKTTINRSSLRNSAVFNTAPNPNGNKIIFERKGLRNVGFLQAAWGLGTLHPNLKSLGLATQLKYNFAAQAYLDGVKYSYPTGGPEQCYSSANSIFISGLPYRIPLVFEIQYEFPFAGANRVVSPSNIQISLSIYAKI